MHWCWATSKVAGAWLFIVTGEFPRVFLSCGWAVGGTALTHQPHPTPAPLLVGCPAGCSRPRCCTRSQSIARSPQHCKPGPEQRCACKLTPCRPVALPNSFPPPASRPIPRERATATQPAHRQAAFHGGLESLGCRFRHCLLSPPPRHVSGAQASVSTGQPAVCGSAELSTSATFVFCCPCLQP